MKIKLLSLMCISMMFMGCDLFGPSCEDLYIELEAAAETYIASALTGNAGHEDCDAYADKMQEYFDAGCGDEEGGMPITQAEITAMQAACTLLEELEDSE